MTPALSLKEHHEILGRAGVATGDYRGATDAVHAALEAGKTLEGNGDLLDRLVMQPGEGQHQLAHYVSHLATSGLTDKATALVAAIEPRLVQLLDTLDSLNTDAQRRTVLFAVVARAFFTDRTLKQDRISALHLSWFTRFRNSDLDLPYSVLFNADIFGRNRDDLIAHYMAQGHLSTTANLSAQHILLLAWLSHDNPLSGPVTLPDVINATDRHDDVQMAALRSLVMRFDNGTLCTDTMLMARLGLEPFTARPPASASAGTSAGNRARLAHLNSRPRMAVALAINRAHITAPFLMPSQRKPKIALCLSGQLRGYKTALQSWQARLFQTIEPHVFIHSWSNIGRSEAQPFRSVLPFAGAAFTKAYQEVGATVRFEDLKTRYPTLFAKLADGASATTAQLQTIYRTDHVVLEDDTAEKFAALTNQQKMHYKIHAADTLARSSGDFDLMLRIRPDLSLRDLAFTWRAMCAALQNAPVVFSERGYGVHYGGLMIGDQFAIASPDTMQTYSNCWTTFPKLAACKFGKIPKDFTGHASLAQTCWLHGLDVRRAPIRFGRLEDAEKLSVADCIAAMEADNTGAPEDLKLLNAAVQDR